MVKAADPRMVIGEVRLVRKTGGRHGDFHAEPPARPSVARRRR
jgi:molybdenum cofactor biosynthesis enzyme